MGINKTGPAKLITTGDVSSSDTAIIKHVFQKTPFIEVIPNEPQPDHLNATNDVAPTAPPVTFQSADTVTNKTVRFKNENSKVDPTLASRKSHPRYFRFSTRVADYDQVDGISIYPLENEQPLEETKKYLDQPKSILKNNVPLEGQPVEEISKSNTDKLIDNYIQQHSYLTGLERRIKNKITLIELSRETTNASSSPESLEELFPILGDLNLLAATIESRFTNLGYSFNNIEDKSKFSLLLAEQVICSLFRLKSNRINESGYDFELFSKLSLEQLARGCVNFFEQLCIIQDRYSTSIVDDEIIYEFIEEEGSKYIPYCCYDEVKFKASSFEKYVANYYQSIGDNYGKLISTQALSGGFVADRVASAVLIEEKLFDSKKNSKDIRFQYKRATSLEMKHEGLSEASVLTSTYLYVAAVACSAFYSLCLLVKNLFSPSENSKEATRQVSVNNSSTLFQTSSTESMSPSQLLACR